MARVTVEDCVAYIPNRFKLVVLASERARNIVSGSPLTVAKDNDKYPVIALREIAAGNIDIDNLVESQIVNLQKNRKIEDVNDENLHTETQDEINLDADYSDNDVDDLFSSEDINIDLDIKDPQ
ncbi:MAG: DNA-directed RNA polymerase subunit omega [Rickettsiaceae bacterium]